MSTFKFTDSFVSRQHRFSMGVEETLGTCYVSFPVSNGMVDYEEYYAIDQADYGRFQNDVQAALDFVEACRRREHDDKLMIAPGRLRGSPI